MIIKHYKKNEKGIPSSKKGIKIKLSRGRKPALHCNGEIKDEGCRPAVFCKRHWNDLVDLRHFGDFGNNSVCCVSSSDHLCFSPFEDLAWEVISDILHALLQCSSPSLLPSLTLPRPHGISGHVTYPNFSLPYCQFWYGLNL